MQLAERLRAEGARLESVTALPHEPWIVLAPLLALQWLLLLAFARHLGHTGWVWGGASTSAAVVTPAHTIAIGRLPDVHAGFGWSYVAAPISLIAGSSLGSVMPAVVVLQALVLMPLALVCVYRIAATIGGRPAGYWTAALWVFSPLLARGLFDPRYHGILDNLVFPQALGLTAAAAYPTMVALLVATALALRLVETGARLDAAGCGLAAGFAIALEPSAVLYLAGLTLAVVLSRRFGSVLPLLAGLALPVIALGVWRLRGSGHLPLAFWDEPGISWSGLNENFIQLREYLWSIRVLEWIPIAGAVAVARRSLPAAGLLGGWLAAVVLLRGGLQSAQVGLGTFFTVLMPVFPAFILLAGAIPLLVPTLGTALIRRYPLGRSKAWPGGWKLLAACAALFGLVPVLLFAVLPTS